MNNTRDFKNPNLVTGMLEHAKYQAAAMYRRLCGCIPYDDLYVAALIGLWRADMGYRPDSGAWKHYASVSIKREVAKCAKSEFRLKNRPMNWRDEINTVDGRVYGNLEDRPCASDASITDGLTEQNSPESILLRKEQQEISEARIGLIRQSTTRKRRKLIDLILADYTHPEAADRLGVTRQAINLRWQLLRKSVAEGAEV